MQRDRYEVIHTGGEKKGRGQVVILLYLTKERWAEGNGDNELRERRSVKIENEQLRANEFLLGWFGRRVFVWKRR